MQFIQAHKGIAIFIGIIILIIIFVASQFIYISVNGDAVAAPQIPRETQTYGNGSVITFVVIGDSTSIGQGADYKQSIAVQSAQFLANEHQVHLTNFGISGATTHTVRQLQVDKAAALKPDVVLLAVGANDVTKFSSYSSVESDMRAMITTLKQANPNVKILLTGTPQVGSVSRFPWAVKVLARYRVTNINRVFDTIAKDENVTRLQIAEKTGDLFLRNPQLFARDNFHPNSDGYATWQPIINLALKDI